MTRRRGRRPLLTAVAGGAVVLLLVGPGPAPAAARPYAPSGKAITGGDDSGAATALSPGVYTDTLARGATGFAGNGSVRFYAMGVRTGQTPYLAVTIAAPATPPAAGQLGIRVSLTAQGESTTCANESGSDLAADDRLDPVTVVVTPGRIGSKDGCPAGNLIVRVERTGDAVLATPLAIEIAYRLEPDATDVGLPGPAATDEPELRTRLTGTPATLASGDNFTTAPLVGTGIYKDALTAGDTRIVMVHLDWGQRFAYAVTSSARPGVTSEDSVTATALVRNPLRQVADEPTGSRLVAFSVGEQDVTLSGSTAAPVRYRNRESDDDDIAAYANAGDYYLVLATDVPRKGNATLTYPYTLQVQVFGSPEQGPDYAGATSGATTSAARDAAGSDDRTGPVVAIIGGTVGLLLVIALVLMWSRRRGRGDAETSQVRAHT